MGVYSLKCVIAALYHESGQVLRLRSTPSLMESAVWSQRHPSRLVAFGYNGEESHGHCRRLPSGVKRMPPMLNSPPQLYLSASGQDRPFVDGLCARLRSRGLAVRESGDLSGQVTPDERQRDIDASHVVLVVISRASMRSAEATADYQYALAHTQQVFPVIVSTANDLPADLSQLQAIDFSVGEQAGWAALLIALDTLGIARYPIEEPPDLDAEVVLARARSGITPPEWYVSRLPVQAGRRLSRWTIYGVVVTIILTVLTYFATGRNLLIVLPALYIIYQLYIKYSPAALRSLKNSPMVILTPDGFVVTTKT